MKRKMIVTGMVATLLIAGTLVMGGCSCSTGSNTNQNATNNSSNASNATNQSSTNTSVNPAPDANSANVAMVGNYKLVEKVDDGVTYNEAQIAAQNKGKTLEVKADGTAVKKEADGDTETYRYDATNFIENDGDVKAYTFENNTIKIKDGNDVDTYQKQ